MEAAMWEINETDGKGKGVFATRDIPVGTAIMVDKPIITIQLPAGLEDLCQALLRLSEEELAAFLTLHDGGSVEHPKEWRIFMSNFFRNGTEANLYLNISRVNHSCVPNATMGEGSLSSGGSSDKNLVASKTIAAGEEICICYLTWLEAIPSQLRGVPTFARYGFICSCHICTLPHPSLELSDTRRRIIGALERALNWYKPDDLQWLKDSDEPLPVSYPDVPHSKQLFEPLDKPLSIPEQTAYHLLLAKARETETMIFELATISYAQASLLLLSQIQAMDDIIVLQSVGLLRSWLEGAVVYADTVDAKERTDKKYMRQIWNNMKTDPQVRTGLRYINSWNAVHGSVEGMPFALQIKRAAGSQKLTSLTQDDCKKIVRARQTKKKK